MDIAVLGVDLGKNVWLPTPGRNGPSFDRRIAAFDAEFVRCVKDHDEARRLTAINWVWRDPRIRACRRRRAGGEL